MHYVVIVVQFKVVVDQYLTPKVVEMGGNLFTHIYHGIISFILLFFLSVVLESNTTFALHQLINFINP